MTLKGPFVVRLFVMDLCPISRGPVVRGTMFWAPAYEMSRRSQVNSKIDRPFLVLNTVGKTAECCPLSSTSDAWNASVSPHFIPYDLNPQFFNHRDSLFAVNRLVKDAKDAHAFSVDQIREWRRVDLPIEFVRMARDLEAVFEADLRGGRIARVTKRRFKDARIQSPVKRIDLVTVDVMHRLFPEVKL